MENQTTRLGADDARGYVGTEPDTADAGCRVRKHWRPRQWRLRGACYDAGAFLSAAMIFSAGTVSCTMLSSRIPATRHCGGVRCIATSRARLFFGRRKPPSSSETHLALRESMFKSEELRNREGFMEVVERFKVNNENRKGHEFGVEKDLEVYKTLFDLFPKGKYTPRTLVQAEFSTFRVIPDRELRQMVLDTFGFRSEVFKKFARMMYWMPKFKHMSPFPLPNPVPRDAFALAQLAVRRMCVDIQSAVSVHQTKEEVQDCVDDTWVVSGQAPDQQRLIEEHPTDKPLRIEGPFSIYLRSSCISYFILRAEPVPIEVIEIDSDGESSKQRDVFAFLPEQSLVVCA
ncbi:hypothetical protein HPB48_023479 [Haemaphysalis longicornis]|uniref:Evolutionarily conserved signaling intermediate in Toll pathway, mitochondrial n=1 Tax=Haemaphysalis longicornis TaxID=44386 RepID=A0A9J6H826_HAELO|nr:hypothetical protein HPB48_023479 [Haemaphysalis longicornis]